MKILFASLLVLFHYSSFAADSDPKNNIPTSYDAIMYMCKFIVPYNHVDLELTNNISPLAAAQAYFHTRGTDLNIFQDPRLGLAPEPFKKKLIEGPLHGKLIERAYYPNDGYTGQDQMIFMVEVKGRRLKVIYSIWVEDIVVEQMYKSPEHEKKCPGGYHIKELPN